jgi:hypothetical protein
MNGTKRRTLRFNPSHFDGATQSQQEIIAGHGRCLARFGTRAVKATPCDAPVVWLVQDGRRRWVISGLCETHGSLTKDLSERENAYQSWARLNDVIPQMARIGGGK